MTDSEYLEAMKEALPLLENLCGLLRACIEGIEAGRDDWWHHFLDIGGLYSLAEEPIIKISDTF